MNQEKTRERKTGSRRYEVRILDPNGRTVKTPLMDVADWIAARYAAAYNREMQSLAGPFSATVVELKLS